MGSRWFTAVCVCILVFAGYVQGDERIVQGVVVDPQGPKTDRATLEPTVQQSDAKFSNAHDASGVNAASETAAIVNGGKATGEQKLDRSSPPLPQEGVLHEVGQSAGNGKSLKQKPAAKPFGSQFVSQAEQTQGGGLSVFPAGTFDAGNPVKLSPWDVKTRFQKWLAEAPEVDRKHSYSIFPQSMFQGARSYLPGFKDVDQYVSAKPLPNQGEPLEHKRARPVRPKQNLLVNLLTSVLKVTLQRPNSSVVQTSISAGVRPTEHGVGGVTFRVEILQAADQQEPSLAPHAGHPMAYFQHEDVTYEYHAVAATWAEAEAHCIRSGGHLATPRSPALPALLHKLVMSLPASTAAASIPRLLQGKDGADTPGSTAFWVGAFRSLAAGGAPVWVDNASPVSQKQQGACTAERKGDTQAFGCVAMAAGGLCNAGANAYATAAAAVDKAAAAGGPAGPAPLGMRPMPCCTRMHFLCQVPDRPRKHVCVADTECATLLERCVRGRCVARLPHGAVCSTARPGDCVFGCGAGLPLAGPPAASTCASKAGLGTCHGCVSNKQCPSGSACSGGKCVAPHSVELGGQCSGHLACASNACVRGVCRECQQASHCPWGHFCDSDSFTCHPRRPHGAACASPVQCAGLGCTGGACVRCNPGACGKAEFCATRRAEDGGGNDEAPPSRWRRPAEEGVCEPRLARGTVCSTDEQCQGGKCRHWALMGPYCQ